MLAYIDPQQGAKALARKKPHVTEGFTHSSEDCRIYGHGISVECNFVAVKCDFSIELKDDSKMGIEWFRRGATLGAGCFKFMFAFHLSGWRRLSAKQWS